MKACTICGAVTESEGDGEVFCGRYLCRSCLGKQRTWMARSILLSCILVGTCLVIFAVLLASQAS